MTKLQLLMFNLISSRLYLLDANQKAFIQRIGQQKSKKLTPAEIKELNALNTFVQ